uniref:CCHC-type domain-containing protein n=1 Tax=Aegilops tauschii subsp. strangulata TaxID=200361 RepID=A0A453C002_AEGTS
MYDIQYEQVPYFCFSCGRLGHSDPYCPTPGSRDEKGELPFGSKMRAPEDLNVTDCWLEETPSFLVTSLLADCPGNAFV